MGFVGDKVWRWAHLAMAGTLLLALGLELVSGMPALWHDRLPSWGFQVRNTQGIARLQGDTLGARVHAVSPRMAGLLQPGDEVVFPKVTQRWRVPHPGQTLDAIRLREGQAPLTLRLEAQANGFTPNERLDYVGRLLAAVPAIGLSLLLGLQRPVSPASRRLALAFLGFAMVPWLNFTLGSLLLPELLKQLAFLAVPWALYQVARFALHVAGQQRPLPRAWQACIWPLRVLTGAAMLGLLLYLNGHALPGLSVVLGGAMGASQGVALAALLRAHAQARGAHRVRARFLVAAFLTGLLPIAVVMALGPDYPGFDPGPLGLPTLLLFVSYFLSYLGLGYGMLRHRVFDLYLALDHAIVYAVSLVFVTAAVFGLKALAESPLKAWLAGLEQGHERLAVEVALAFSIYLTGHFTFHWLDHRVQHFIGRRRRERGDPQRPIKAQAHHITGREALLRGLHKALERFGEGAGNVIYLRLAGGDFAQVFNSIPGAPHLLEGDDATLVQMRHEPQPHWLDSGDPRRLDSEVQGSLALPMLRRGQLVGLVVMALRAERESYRPDEVRLLNEAVAQASLDLQAIAANRWDANDLGLAQPASPHA